MKFVLLSECTSFLWQLICLCFRVANQLIYVISKPLWLHLVSSRTLFRSSVRRRWWGLNPSAGTPPLDLFFFRPDKSAGLPSSHKPILQFLILSSGKMDPLGSNQGLGILFLPGLQTRVPQQVTRLMKKTCSWIF